jgi:quercetin dioxygenase-like cupin family protein
MNEVRSAQGKVVHYTEIPAQVFGDQAPGTTIRWLIDDDHDGAPVYALRLIEVAPGGHTPRHSHPYEHENFVIEGQGRVQIDGEWHAVSVGDVIFVPPNARHTYVNAGDTPFKFLCGIPVSRLMPKA